MNMFLLGLLSGGIISVAVLGVINEMKDREREKISRLKYATRKHKMIELRMKGKTLQQISNRTGVPVSTVYRYVK